MSRHLPRLVTSHVVTRPAAVLVLGAATCASVQSCNLVLGLDAYYDCPEDPRCPPPDTGTTATTTTTPTGTGGNGGQPPAPTCSDGTKNGNETDKDCGGTCDPCQDGEGCLTGADCQSKVCSSGSCVIVGCDDKIKNGDETDVDCGGKTCTPCGFGLHCAAATDCATAFCNGTTCDAETIVGGLVNPNSLSVAFDNAYWTDADLGTVTQADLATGTPLELAAGLSSPENVVVVPGYMFWLEPPAGKVMVKPNAIGLPPTLYKSGQVHPSALAYDGVNIYWTDRGSGPSNYDGSVWTGYADDSGSGTSLAATIIQPDRIGAVSGAAVFSTLGGDIARVSKSSGPPTTLATGVSVNRLTVDSTFVYWTDGGAPGTVAKIPIAGGAPAVIADGQATPTTIAVDTLYVYWANQGASPGSGTIMKAALSGGPPVVLASSQNKPGNLALYGTHVYWTTYGDNSTSTVRRAHR